MRCQRLTLCLVGAVVVAGIALSARSITVLGEPTGANAVQAPARPPAPPSIIGRWDLTVTGPKSVYPSWLEVTLSGSRTLVGRFVGGGGSARPISRVVFDNGAVRFSIPPQWERDTADMAFDATLTDDTLQGTIVTPAGERHPFTGRRAPALRRSGVPTWGTPTTLFTGTDLTGWTTFGGTSQWAAKAGVLENAKSGANLKTTATFSDFKLHLEVNCPKGSNSGIYLRGRYEVQVEDGGGPEPRAIDMGAIYGFLVPNENATTGSGTWQTFDITLVGRRVTVVLNGKTIIADQTIPGITGGALDSAEGAPGPIFLQGDHGAVSYRNIVITPAMDGGR